MAFIVRHLKISIFKISDLRDLHCNLVRSSFKWSSVAKKMTECCLDLKKLSRMPRLAVEVEDTHLLLLETSVFHQGCFYKWNQMVLLSNWTTGTWESGQIKKQLNQLSASCHLEVSDSPLPDFQNENHILSQMIIIEMTLSLKRV